MHSAPTTHDLRRQSAALMRFKFPKALTSSMRSARRHLTRVLCIVLLPLQTTVPTGQCALPAVPQGDFQCVPGVLIGGKCPLRRGHVGFARMG